MAASYAFGPSEDDIIIKDRLLTHATTGKGGPPLKKLHKKFTFFLQELATFEIPLLRSKATVEANVRQKENLAELKDEISGQILQVQADIEGLKKQLEESKIERSRKKYCEAIQKFISLYPTRSEKHKLLTDLDKEIESLDTDNTASYTLLELRRKQFTLLLRAVVELQNTIEEEKKGLIEDIRATIEKHKNGWRMQGEARKLGLLTSNRFSFQSSCGWITWCFILVCLFCGYWKGFWNRK